MKKRYLLFLTSCLCGIALAFTYSFYVHADENAHGVTPQPSNTYVLSDTQALNIANRLVGDRDAALTAHDHKALQSLTVPRSPARQLDDALFKRVGNLDSVNTVVLDVHVLTDKEWKVQSVQREINMSDGSSSEGKEICTVWRMEANPWRVYEARECS